MIFPPLFTETELQALYQRALAFINYQLTGMPDAPF